MTFDLILTIASGVVLILSLGASYIAERLWISEVLLSLVAGIALGAALRWAGMTEPLGSDPAPLLEQILRLTLAIAVMGVALRVPTDFVPEYRASLAIVLLAGLSAMWLASAAIVHWVASSSTAVA